jgi:MoaA/NifB/PqqE/SkfB family radical SAM enzyme
MSPADSVPRKITSIAIETTKLCNSHCVVCPRELLKPELNTTMPLEDFKTVTRRVFDYFDVEGLTVGGFGDIAVDRFLIDRLQWLKHDFGWRTKSVQIATNGAPMARSVLDRIFEQNLVTTFTWSLFADDRETYIRTNQRDQFAKASEHLEYALEAKRRSNSDVAIRLYTLLLEENKDTFHQVIARWSGRVDALEAWLPHNWSDKRVYRQNTFGDQPPPCSRVMDLDMVVRSNGDVTACCLDINHALVYGNLLASEFGDVFAPESFYWTLRREHETGTVPPQSLCHNCDFLNNRSQDAQIYWEENGAVKIDLVTGRSPDQVLQLNVQGPPAQDGSRPRLLPMATTPRTR